jgi:L-fucose mutarotase/ribose pyranase (RbsD/FucU family)
MTKHYLSLILLVLLIPASSFAQTSKQKTSHWETVFDKQLPLLGHRNWILIVDKAFPAQTSAGMEIVNTEGDILDVAKRVLDKLNASSHVKPIIYLDKEFDFLTAAQIPQIEDFRNQYKSLFKNYSVQNMLHESVFSKLDEASKLFKIVVLKTDCLIPYSSIFIELDCKYWNEKAEQELRKNMK